MTTPIADLADRYVTRAAALDPIAATFEGLPGHDDELTDYSPDGISERLAHDRATLHELDRTPATDEADRVAAEVLRRYLDIGIDLSLAGESLRAVRILGSPVSDVRMVFDLMPRETEADWDRIAARAAALPQCLVSFQDALTEGAREALPAARRQVVACARQADTWGGQIAGDAPPFFLGLVDAFDASGLDQPALRARLTDVMDRATRAYASLGRYLVEEYLPSATDQDAVGEERYARWARAYNGTVLDLTETYAWGWDELHRIEHAMASVANRVLPGESIPAVIDHLEHDPTRMITGADAFRAWLQDLLDRTIAELDGVHFDLPDPVKLVEAMIAPPGGAAAMYYTGPSEDFSRPGRTWYPTLGRTEFPLWGEVSICYHEGVPGHHLQIAMVRYLTGRLNRFQRTLAGNSGHAEGWALYAERLMGELGYLDDPAFELGMLRAQAMRAVRVVVDIGLHLELEIPAGGSYHPGERWTPDLALPFVVDRSHFPPDFMASEVDRYLGLPGQAISYKVGERVWLRGRDAARRRHGDGFDLKAFHEYALALGPMGLDQLDAELARF
ncbi:MAG TPA: DUF885 domain-containing protein [Acidimicrobiia bacterium]|nr:DUF885 domain-containing protein [Acidimicrobiia bacterium]